MKVGILTFHRAHNYGAVLQCYALQELIKSWGHDVEVIDYKQPFIEWRYSRHISIINTLRLIRHKQFASAVSNIKDFIAAPKRNIIFTSFRESFLRCRACNETQIPMIYDRYIIGSDQMWGLHCTNGYDPIYWGNFNRPSNSKLFGYAISANGDYRNLLTKEQIRKNLENFADISFREESIRDDIKTITGKEGRLSIDPTLLTNSSTWDSLINDEWKTKRFVVIYQIRRKKDAPKLLEKAASKYAHEHECKVIDLTQMNYSVSDFISAIKYAQCVFTSSFHATVFSIIFNTPFFAFKLNDMHDYRYASLLHTLELNSHLVENVHNAEQPEYMNKDKIQSKILTIQTESLEYLNSILS